MLKESASLTALTKFDLYNCSKMKDNGQSCLVNLTSQRDLNLDSWFEITDVGVESLVSLTSVNKINLYTCHGITDECLTWLATLTSLGALNLGFCWRIVNIDVETLALLTAVTKMFWKHGGWLELFCDFNIMKGYQLGLALEDHKCWCPIIVIIDCTHQTRFESTDDSVAWLTTLTSFKGLNSGSWGKIT